VKRTNFWTQNSIICLNSRNKND